MGSFSERMGLKLVRQTLQTRAMDDALRNSIWNVLHDIFILPGKNANIFKNTYTWDFFRAVWTEYLKKPIDAAPWNWADTLREFRAIYFSSSWYEVYDLLEFAASLATGLRQRQFVEDLNRVLAREMAGYRMVSGQIVPVTGEEEISAIEAAVGNPLCRGAGQHMQRALELLAQKPDPDLRNSIKESISAVESAAKFIANDDKADLAKALKAISSKIGMHGALEKGLLSVYGYTSDEGGIRHAMQDDPNVSLADAKFMLVACSGFVNYLIEKGLETGLTQAAI